MTFKADLTLTMGLAKTLNFTWQANGVPVDLTGCTAKLSIVDPVTGNVLVTLTTANGGGITLGGVNGTIALAFTAAQTLLITDQSKFDMLIYYASGNQAGDILMQGLVSILTSVTAP